MDGIITVNGDDVVRCFAYFCENTTQVVGAGNYDIKAVVHSILLFYDIGTDFANAVLPQVTSMHEQMNDVLFELRGDIFSVCPSNFSLYPHLHNLQLPYSPAHLCVLTH